MLGQDKGGQYPGPDRSDSKIPGKNYHPPGAKADIDTRALARAAAEKGVVLEINSSHRHMTKDYIMVAKQEAKFALGSDAHSPRRVGDVRAAAEIALRAGLVPGDVINAKTEGVKG